MGPLLIAAGLAAAPFVGRAIGKKVGAARADRDAAEIEASDAGQFQAKKRQEATTRQTTGKYGMTDAQKRQGAAEIAAPAKAEGRSVMQEMLRVAAAGGARASGAATEGLKSVSDAGATALTQAGKAMTGLSQDQANIEKQVDANVMANRLAVVQALQDRKAKKMQQSGKQGEKAGSAVADVATGYGMGGATSGAAGP